MARLSDSEAVDAVTVALKELGAVGRSNAVLRRQIVDHARRRRISGLTPWTLTRAARYALVTGYPNQNGASGKRVIISLQRVGYWLGSYEELAEVLRMKKSIADGQARAIANALQGQASVVPVEESERLCENLGESWMEDVTKSWPALVSRSVRKLLIDRSSRGALTDNAA